MDKKNIPKVAIVITVNDINNFHGGSKNGLKKKISYFDQFLILYESINKKWKKINFEFEFYLLHSIKFSNERRKILEQTDVNVFLVNYPKHKTKIRPMAYTIDIDCDFRLVLDVDMIALSEPKFDFTCDFQAMYGGNKYNKEQWVEICNFINCKFPDYPILNQKFGKYNSWSIKEMNLFQSGKLKEKCFPYFNNGAIFIRNSLSKKFVTKWEKSRELYTSYVKKKFNIDIDLEGQDVVGIVLYETSANWKPFEIGFNFPVQEAFEDSRRLLQQTPTDKISLAHYINIQNNPKWLRIIYFEYLKVLSKYYKENKVKLLMNYLNFIIRIK